MNQVDRVPSEVSEADMAGRLDLRDVVMVTIDGLVQKEQAACDGYNMVKQFYLRTMFV